MMLNVVAPVLGLVAGAMDYTSVLKAWLTLLGWLSGWVLFCLFALGIVGLLAVLGMRLADRITLRLGPAARVPAIVDRGIVTLTAVYCAWAMALTLNGTFDHASATEHRSEILDVSGIPKTPLWWRTFARGTRPAASSACSSSRSATRECVVNLSDDRSLYDAHRRQVGADRDGPLPAPPPGVVEPPDAPAPSTRPGGGARRAARRR